MNVQNYRHVQATDDLPASGQQPGDICYVMDNEHYYEWHPDTERWEDVGTIDVYEELALQFLPKGITEEQFRQVVHELRKLVEKFLRGEALKIAFRSR